MRRQAASILLTVQVGKPQPFLATGKDPAYERYLVNCSDYLKRQMMIYEHWPQRRYDVLGYREEKVFTDMNN